MIIFANKPLAITAMIKKVTIDIISIIDSPKLPLSKSAKQITFKLN